MPKPKNHRAQAMKCGVCFNSMILVYKFSEQKVWAAFEVEINYIFL